MTPVAWSAINDEFEDIGAGYRERIVALFRKYEGQETDELTRGKPVKVTVNSFARHMGIKQQTLYTWVKTFGNPISVTQNRVTENPVAPPACLNEGAPPAEGFVREVNRRLSECLPYLRHLSPETHLMIVEDIAATRALLNEIEAAMTTRSAK